MTDFHVFIYVNSNKDDTNENPFNIQIAYKKWVFVKSQILQALNLEFDRNLVKNEMKLPDNRLTMNQW